jgi:lipid II:glycine glycyltransferase (peptidoglycan interpeptide bridge formation enzyme)
MSEHNHASTISIIHADDAAWDTFVAGAPNGHLLQTSHWGHFKSAAGWEAVRVCVGAGGTILAGALMLVRRLPLGLRLAYVPKGPVGPWWEPEIARRLFPALDQAARAHGAFMLKLEPEEPEPSPAVSVLRQAGYRPSPQTVQPRSTIWVDLTLPEDEMLARMKPKTRYNIRLAERKEVMVREGTAADLPAFYAVMQETSRRDGFALHPLSYYEEVFGRFTALDACRLFLAYYQEQMLAGIMVFQWGAKAWYMYGASSNAERQRMPNHALQWAAMQWARRRGCHTYDLWGIPDEVGQAPERYTETVTERQDGLWGVYRFKQGFGGRVVRYIGAFDRVYAPALYRLYHVALSFRRRLSTFPGL